MTARWTQTLSTSLVDGDWPPSAPVRRPAGVTLVAAMARVEADDIDDATVELVVEGAVAHPGLADSWLELGAASVDPGSSAAWLGVDGMLPVPPVSYLRLRASHSGGNPSSASITLYLSADRS